MISDDLFVFADDWNDTVDVRGKGQPQRIVRSNDRTWCRRRCEKQRKYYILRWWLDTNVSLINVLQKNVLSDISIFTYNECSRLNI